MKLFRKRTPRQVSVRIKARLMTPTGYETVTKTFRPQTIAPRHKLVIPLDAWGDNHIEILLEEKGLTKETKRDTLEDTI